MKPNDPGSTTSTAASPAARSGRHDQHFPADGDRALRKDLPGHVERHHAEHAQPDQRGGRAGQRSLRQVHAWTVKLRLVDVYP